MPKEEETKQEAGQHKESEVTDQISSVFSSSNIQFERDVIVGSSSTDFFVISPSGSTSIFEVKLWEPSQPNIERARKLASLYEVASGVDHAFVVLPGLPSSSPDTGVVTIADLDTVVASPLVQEKKGGRKRKPEVRKKPAKKIFASMPFADKYDDTYIFAMQPASLEVNAECVRVDYERFTGDIVDEIKRLTNESIAIIADISESRPNVLFEIGYGDGIGRPIFQVCSTALEEIPFDIRNNKTLPYTIGQVSKLQPALADLLKGVLG